MGCFSIDTKIYWGTDATDLAINVIRVFSFTKVLFLIDHELIRTSGVNKLLRNWQDASFDLRIIEVDCSTEPSYPFLDELTDRVRNLGAELIVAVGGGSTLDLAKGVGILLRNPGKGIEYRGMNKVQFQGIPVVCYPATAGTGSEVTHTASFIDPENQTKLGINGRFVSPLFGVLMPELVMSCPRSVALSSGLDAMVHALEAVSAANSNDITRIIGAEAFGLIYNNLPQALIKQDNYQAQERVLLGSYLAGIAMMNAGGGAASGISYPLGVHYKVPHGFAGGIFLPHIIRLYLEKGFSGFASCYRKISDKSLSLSDASASKAFLECFTDFYESIGGPKNLSKWEVRRSQVDNLVQLTVQERQDNLRLSPVPCSGDDIRKLLEAVTEE